MKHVFLTFVDCMKLFCSFLDHCISHLGSFPSWIVPSPKLERCLIPSWKHLFSSFSCLLYLSCLLNLAHCLFSFILCIVSFKDVPLFGQTSTLQYHLGIQSYLALKAPCWVFFCHALASLLFSVDILRGFAPSGSMLFSSGASLRCILWQSGHGAFLGLCTNPIRLPIFAFFVLISLFSQSIILAIYMPMIVK